MNRTDEPRYASIETPFALRTSISLSPTNNLANKLTAKAPLSLNLANLGMRLPAVDARTPGWRR